MDIDNILASGDVERFHSVPGMVKQDIANHSWGVALLVQYFDPNCRKELLLAALTHDCAELKTGDIPADVKWENPDLKKALSEMEERIEKEWGIHYNLTAQETTLLKICDCLEGMTYCLKRLNMGEQGAGYPFGKWYNFLKENYLLTPLQQGVFDNLTIQAWDKIDKGNRGL